MKPRFFRKAICLANLPGGVYPPLMRASGGGSAILWYRIKGPDMKTPRSDVGLFKYAHVGIAAREKPVTSLVHYILVIERPGHEGRRGFDAPESQLTEPLLDARV